MSARHSLIIVNDGDAIVLCSESHLSQAQAAPFVNALRNQFPEAEVMLLPPGLTITVVSRSVPVPAMKTAAAAS